MKLGGLPIYPTTFTQHVGKFVQFTPSIQTPIHLSIPHKYILDFSHFHKLYLGFKYCQSN
jgi:hypothetical protein